MSSTASDGTTYTEDTSACGDFPECHDETAPCRCQVPALPKAETPAPRKMPALIAAADELTPDPEVRSAILRLYAYAPGLLDTATYVHLARAQGMSPQDMVGHHLLHPRPAFLAEG